MKLTFNPNRNINRILFALSRCVPSPTHSIRLSCEAGAIAAAAACLPSVTIIIIKAIEESGLSREQQDKVEAKMKIIAFALAILLHDARARVRRIEVPDFPGTSERCETTDN